MRISYAIIVVLSSLIKICTADAIARQTDNQLSTEVPTEVMQCMDEHNEVPRYHIYKANNADFYVQARLENTSDEVSVLYPGIMKVIRTDEDSLQVPEKTRELFVNLSASDCVNKMRTDRDYIMFLKKTDQMLAEYDVILDKETKSPVWVSMAEPIKYKRKKMREITKYLDESKYCKGCPEQPYIKKVHQLEPVMETKLKHSVLLECKVKGFPQPYMYWKFNGHPLEGPASKSIKVTTSWKKSVLEIPFVTWQHPGYYSCHGTNFKDPEVKTELHLKLADVEDCSLDYLGFCMNGGFCIHRIRENRSECHCTKWYVGERCEHYNPYPSVLPGGDRVLDEGGSYMVPLKDVLLICFVIVALASLFLIVGCIYIAHKNKNNKAIQRKLAQSLDYSNNFAPGQLKKGAQYAGLASVPNGNEILLTNSFMKRPRKPKGSQGIGTEQAMEDLFGTKSKRKSRGQSFLAEQNQPMLSQSPIRENSNEMISVHSPQEQLILPIRNSFQCTSSAMNGNHHDNVADNEEERSRVSDETDCTVTNEHRISKDGNPPKISLASGEPREQIVKVQKNSSLDYLQEGSSKYGNEKTKVINEPKKNLASMNFHDTSIDVLSDDDSPSPMSNSELSLSTVL